MGDSAKWGHVGAGFGDDDLGGGLTHSRLADQGLGDLPTQAAKFHLRKAAVWAIVARGVIWLIRSIPTLPTERPRGRYPAN